MARSGRSAQPPARQTSAQPRRPVAVLALQGDFAAHGAALAALGWSALEVRSGAQLVAAQPAGLVLPGGESTAMLRLMEGNGLAEAITACAHREVPILATCAGLILLAREVHNPAQASLGVLDVTVERNAYGRQRKSAVVPLRIAAGSGLEEPWIEGVFIRAPRVVRVGEGVEVLAWRDGDPVLMRQGRILAATFHPELSPHSPILRLFTHSLEETS